MRRDDTVLADLSRGAELALGVVADYRGRRYGREVRGHYFDENPDSPSRPASVTLTVDEQVFDLRTDRGVFSPRRIDPGTAALIDRRRPSRDHGTFVDLGCGYGPIAVAVAHRAPNARVIAVDVNERARALCRANVERLGLGNVEVLSPDDVERDLVVDELWSNPPIRIGKPALQSLLSEWLTRLAPDGVGELVVSKHLGADSLVRWLIERGYTAERTGSRQGYRLLHVERA